jgi:hypothetical protein
MPHGWPRTSDGLFPQVGGAREVDSVQVRRVPESPARRASDVSVPYLGVLGSKVIHGVGDAE